MRTRVPLWEEKLEALQSAEAGLESDTRPVLIWRLAAFQSESDWNRCYLATIRAAIRLRAIRRISELLREQEKAQTVRTEDGPEVRLPNDGACSGLATSEWVIDSPHLLLEF